MAGLSISRRAALSRTASSIVANNPTKTRKHAIHRHHPLPTRTGESASTQYAVDKELPAAWSMACMAFTGVIEFTRFVSPASLAVDLVSRLREEETKVDTSETKSDSTAQTEVETDEQSVSPTMVFDNFPWLSKPNTQSSLKTIADYTIGGAMGGALFAGSAVRTRVGRKMDAAILGTARRGGPLAGLLPGAALGLLAGVAIVSVDFAREMLEEQLGETDEEFDESSTPQKEDNNDAIANVIPAHIKAMSTEELAQAIEDLNRLNSRDRE